MWVRRYSSARSTMRRRAWVLRGMQIFTSGSGETRSCAALSKASRKAKRGCSASKMLWHGAGRRSRRDDDPLGLIQEAGEPVLRRSPPAGAAAIPLQVREASPPRRKAGPASQSWWASKRHEGGPPPARRRRSCPADKARCSSVRLSAPSSGSCSRARSEAALRRAMQGDTRPMFRVTSPMLIECKAASNGPGSCRNELTEYATLSRGDLLGLGKLMGLHAAIARHAFFPLETGRSAERRSSSSFCQSGPRSFSNSSNHVNVICRISFYTLPLSAFEPGCRLGLRFGLKSQSSLGTSPNTVHLDYDIRNDHRKCGANTPCARG